MKNNKKIIVAVVMGAFLLSGCGNNFVDTTIENNMNHNFTVEFEEGTEVTTELLASIEEASHGVVVTHPYENLYRMKKEDATHEELESMCKTLSTLPYVKLAQTEWDK